MGGLFKLLYMKVSSQTRSDVRVSMLFTVVKKWPFFPLCARIIILRIRKLYMDSDKSEGSYFVSIQFSCKKSLIVSRSDKEYCYTCDLFSPENIDF